MYATASKKHFFALRTMLVWSATTKTWVEQHPDDLDAMTRIGRNLSMQGRTESALRWYRKAIGKAPSDTKLREALIEELVRDKRYADAISEYEQFAEVDRNNPDCIERWGMLYLKRKRPARDGTSGTGGRHLEHTVAEERRRCCGRKSCGRSVSWSFNDRRGDQALQAGR